MEGFGERDDCIREWLGEKTLSKLFECSEVADSDRIPWLLSLRLEVLAGRCLVLEPMSENCAPVNCVRASCKGTRWVWRVDQKATCIHKACTSCFGPSISVQNGSCLALRLVALIRPIRKLSINDAVSLIKGEEGRGGEGRGKGRGGII